MIYISENFIIDGYNNRTILRDTIKEKVLSQSHYSPFRDVMLEANFLSEKPRRATGDGGEENDWIPKVDKNGKISYEMEEGDSIKTLQSQFGLTETEAQQLMPADLKPGEAISGTTVKMLTGSEILRLDLHNKQTAEHVNDQFIFALLHSEVQEKIGFFTSEYFDIDYTKPEMLYVSLKLRNIEFNYGLPLYNTNYSQGIFHPKAYPYFISNQGFLTESSQKGNMFGKLEHIQQLRFNIYLTYGKKPEGENLKSQGYMPIFFNSPTPNQNINTKKFIRK